MEETKEVMDVVDVAPEDVEVVDLPPVDESSGFGTLKSAAGLIAGAAVVGLGIVKGSQAIYKKRCAKKGTGIPVREKKYQFWRPKAKGEIKTDTDVVDGVFTEDEAECEN